MRRILTVVSLFTLALSSVAFAQVDRATITGTVTDSGGAVIAGATVTITNLATNVAFRQPTTETGSYLLVNLIPGKYQVDVEQYVLTCDACQRNKHSKQLTPGLLMPLPLPEEPCLHWTTDAVTGLPKSKGGYDAIPDFLVNDALEDITDYVADDADRFTEWQWETGVFDDRVYSIPQASGPLGQFYRKDIFDSLGLAAPTTWEEYYEAAKAIHASDPNRYIAAFAFNQAPWLIGLSQQGGGEWFSTEGDSWKVAIDDEATLKVAEFWQRLIDEGLVKIEADFSSEWNADMQNGNVASWISGSWADAIVRGTAPDTAGNWAVAPMPQWSDGETVSATWAGGSANVVLKGSEHPEEAAEFALWLNSDPASVSTLTSIGAGWPAITDLGAIESLQDDPEVFAFYGGQDIWDVFAESDAAVAATWKWPPLSQTLFASLTDNVKAAVEAGTPLTEAYTATQADFVAALQDKGISVAE